MTEIEKAAFKAPTEAHWYLPTGAPFHKVPYKDKKRAGELKDATLRDAREVLAARSVTSIQKFIAKQQLEMWGKNQLLDAIRRANFEGLMHTLIEDEQGFAAELEKWLTEIIGEANKVREEAAKRGDQLHEALLLAARGKTFPAKWSAHVEAVQTALSKLKIDILAGQAEISFYSSEGYGGTIDWHRRIDPVVLDYKTREKLDEKIRLAYPEKAMQLAAYRRAIGLSDADCYNVFVDLEANVCVHHWDEPTLRREEKKFKLLNEYVHVSDRYWPTEAVRTYRMWEKPIK